MEDPWMDLCPSRTGCLNILWGHTKMGNYVALKIINHEPWYITSPLDQCLVFFNFIYICKT